MSKIVPIIFLVGSGLMFFFIIDPVYNGKTVATADTPVEQLGIKDIRTRKAAYDDVLLRARDLQAKRDGLQAKYRSITQVDKTRLEQLLPDTLDNVRLVLDIDRIAAKSGLRIKNIAVSDVGNSDKKQISGGDEKGFGSATITFSISAPYDVFLGFLNDLEDGLRLIDITALSINPKDQKSYDYSVTFKTYWLKK
jgi:hypothetical protein